MKNATINLKYSEARAKALDYFLEKEGKTISGELLSHIDELYNSSVPESVREYIDSKLSESDQEKEQQQDQDEQKSVKGSRQGGKRKQVQTEGSGDAPAERGPVLIM